MRIAAHAPASMMIVPSPPGRWNARPSARANSTPSTNTLTSSTAASTNEKAPKAVNVLCVGCSVPFTTKSSVFVYHGSSIVTNRPTAAEAASRSSACIARQAATIRVAAPRGPEARGPCPPLSEERVLMSPVPLNGDDGR